MAAPFAHPKVTLSPEILENLKGLFSKPCPLESFEWEVPEISGPGILVDLLKLLEKSCLTLRKLKIIHPLMDLEKSQELLIFAFIKSLKSIEILSLTGLNIMKEPFWVDLVDCLQGRKLLRFLGLGNVTQGLLEEWFTEPLKKIAQKRGLEILRISSPLQFEGGVKERLSYLKEIMKVNPGLREVSLHARNLESIFG